MALGLINLNSKEDLEKLTKDQLINIIIGKNKTEKEDLEKVLNMSEKELIEYQKELKLIREFANAFVAVSGVNNG
jgi:ferredoxin-fold anticodon binding domain-containing protein